MGLAWSPAPVICTKIASKLVRTYTDRHGLKDLCRDLAGVEISKQQQTSDWGAPELTPEQMTYAASDVLYLHAIWARLEALLARENRLDLAQACLCLPADSGAARSARLCGAGSFSALERQSKWPLFGKSGTKNFCNFGPGAAKPARPKVAKFFCYFLFTKSSLSSFPPHYKVTLSCQGPS